MIRCEIILLDGLSSMGLVEQTKNHLGLSLNEIRELSYLSF